MSPFEAPYLPEKGPSGLEFADPVWAAALLAVDPRLGGISLRAWSGPARDEFTRCLSGLFPTTKKMPLGITDDRLLGGIDLAATLAAGRPVTARGLLEQAAGGLLILAMAERIATGTGARIAAALDAAGDVAILALDEGMAEEAPPAALLERLAFTIAALPANADWPTAHQITTARARLAATRIGAETVGQLCAMAAMLATGSARAEIFALRAARAAAALAGHAEIDATDIAIAARLVLAPRATQIPAPPEPPPPPEAEDDTPAPQNNQDDTQQPLEDTVADAARAVLPPELLAAIAGAGPKRAARGAGTAGTTASLKRGRPAGSRRGALGGDARLALLDTLRAAAPWQPLRKTNPGQKIAIRAEDFRIRRFKEQARTIAIFAVDASGSAAINRLAEAKGAIQLLLAECYVRRDQVALLAFRGRAADCLLPPTHALARAKRALAGLPGGGPTPLATGIAAARALAAAEQRKGHKPLLVLLTDGGANIGRDGNPGRAAAAADAMAAARLCRADNLSALVVDTAPRGNAFVVSLAREMAGRYLKLPYADAASLSALSSRPEVPMPARPETLGAIKPQSPARPGRPDWSTDGKDWPNRAASRFVRAGAMRWHVQIAGTGPVILLLHGTGAATHSWRDMLPLLAAHFSVVAPDLPGHGFTDEPETAGMTLPGMARGVAALLAQLKLQPVLAVGHSAGAAVLAEMSLAGLAPFRGIVSLNGALLPLPFHGIAAPIMGPLAKLLASNKLVPMIFAWQAADGKVVDRLIAGTGSKIDAAGKAFYARLARRSGHAGAALTMMANWDLATLAAALPKLPAQTLLVTGLNDRSIPPSDAERLHRVIPASRVHRMPGLGHLSHEEQPAETARVILDFARETGALP